jgi:multidrug efflux pump
MPLKEWGKRKRSPAFLTEELREKTRKMFSVDVHPWSWDTGLPGIDEAGNATGLSLVLQTIGSYKELFTAIESFRQELEKKKWFKDISYDLHLNTSGYSLDINQLRLSQAGLTPTQISTILQVYFEGMQSLFFQKDHVRYPITLETISPPWELNEIYLTNPQNHRISLGALMQLRPTALPKELRHYNQMRAATLSITLAPGDDFQAAMKKLESLKAKVLPPTIKTEWSGLAKAFNESSSVMLGLLLMGLIFVYAILAMQFESFADPFIIILTVPLACTGALLTLLLVGQSFNIYTQIGLITLIGLITKHGILLVEFANQQKAAGKSARDAAQISASLRLRPILMTTSAMVVGSVPLILSAGAGNEARRAIGYVLVGGLSLGTLFTLFVIPAAYVVVSEMSLQNILSFRKHFRE